MSIRRLVPELVSDRTKKQLDAIFNPWSVWLDGLDGLDGLETVWTVWKRSDVSGTMPEVSEIQF